MAIHRKQVGLLASAGKRLVPEITYADGLRQALQWFSRSDSFADLKLHGNVRWEAFELVSLAVLWVWSDKATLSGAFAHAYCLAGDIFDGPAAVTTYQGLTGALRSYTGRLLPRLWRQLHVLMERWAGPHWRIGKWLALAVDGSRVSTPRTQSNERAFSAANYGHGGKTKSRAKWKNKKRRSKKLSEPVKPQIWLTLIWHMGLKMPWSWKTGPSTACERHHLQEMLETHDFPEHSLFCADAGFVGHELWKTILDRGHSFLIRVGGNVHLLRKLGHARCHKDFVHLWPNTAMRQRMPALALRLLEFQGPRGKVFLVTNILSPRELSSAQASQLYRLRWGVELQFRAFKQTFGRRKLRSRTADNALLELDWSLVGLWMIQLFAAKEQIKIQGLPEHSSVALALHIVQDAMCNWTDPLTKPQELTCRLRGAVKDSYQRARPKTARYRPKYKDPPSATRPRIVNASRQQRQAFRELSHAARNP